MNNKGISVSANCPKCKQYNYFYSRVQFEAHHATPNGVSKDLALDLDGRIVNCTGCKSELRLYCQTNKAISNKFYAKVDREHIPNATNFQRHLSGCTAQFCDIEKGGDWNSVQFGAKVALTSPLITEYYKAVRECERKIKDPVLQKHLRALISAYRANVPDIDERLSPKNVTRPMRDWPKFT